MLDLNHMVIEQLKERDVSFPDVTKGVLVPVVSFFIASEIQTAALYPNK